MATGSISETALVCKPARPVRSTAALYVRGRTTTGTSGLLVRLAQGGGGTKAELNHLKSFVIELIMAYVLDTRGKAGSIEEGFRRFLHYIAQSELKETIKFKEYADQIKPFDEPVVIIDPVYGQNNVASRISEEERKEIVQTAKEAWKPSVFTASVEGEM